MGESEEDGNKNMRKGNWRIRRGRKEKYEEEEENRGREMGESEEDGKKYEEEEENRGREMGESEEDGRKI
jgi:hypothetical protein